MPLSARERLRQFHACFKSDDHVLVPINADPDAIACAWAVKRLLWRKVANVTISNVNVIWIETRRSTLLWGANPTNLASASYVPMGRAGNLYFPYWLVIILLLPPISLGDEIVTSTPRSGSP